jgi:hypothetical protein
MDRGSDVLVQKLVEMHPGWDLAIERPPAGPAKGFVRQRSGSGLVRYVFGEDEKGGFLEFYSFHRIWGDLHARIYEDGTVEGLDVLDTTLPTTGNRDEDRRRAEAQNGRNQRLLRELDDAGLLADGPVPVSFTINAAIAGGLLDPGEGPEPEPRAGD